MNSLRLVEPVFYEPDKIIAEKTKAQIRAEESKVFFIDTLQQMSVDFSIICENSGVTFTEYFYRESAETDDSTTFIDGFVVFEPNKDVLHSEWQPTARIIFSRDVGAYYQPQEYDKSQAHQQLCYPIDELDKYDIRTKENALKFLEFIRDMTLDTITQSRIRNFGKHVAEFA